MLAFFFAPRTFHIPGRRISASGVLQPSADDRGPCADGDLAAESATGALWPRHVTRAPERAAGARCAQTAGAATGLRLPVLVDVGGHRLKEHPPLCKETCFFFQSGSNSLFHHLQFLARGCKRATWHSVSFNWFVLNKSRPNPVVGSALSHSSHHQVTTSTTKNSWKLGPCVLQCFAIHGGMVVPEHLEKTAPTNLLFNGRSL